MRAVTGNGLKVSGCRWPKDFGLDAGSCWRMAFWPSYKGNTEGDLVLCRGGNATRSLVGAEVLCIGEATGTFEEVAGRLRSCWCLELRLCHCGSMIEEGQSY